MNALKKEFRDLKLEYQQLKEANEQGNQCLLQYADQKQIDYWLTLSDEELDAVFDEIDRRAEAKQAKKAKMARQNYSGYIDFILILIYQANFFFILFCTIISFVHIDASIQIHQLR